MKNITTVILLALVVLGAVVPGCDRVPRYDGRLTALDSLMRGNPDSVVAVLEALTADSFASEGDHAYRDLLLTQARYKAYITAISDSDINRALAYFSAHPSDREKLTRAYIYKGAVMNELGHPDSAMLYYKTAEATAAPDDYFNLAYSNLRIAQLYQRFYTNDSAVVARMIIAARYFKYTPDTNYLAIALGTQGAYPKIIGNDSARIYLKRAIHLFKKIHSPKGMQYQSKLAGIHFFDGDYLEAKELAMDLIRDSSNKSNERQYYYYAARAFIHLNLLDSARWVMSMTPAPKNAVDSFNHFQTLAELSKATQRLSDYVRYNEAAKEIDNRIMETSRNSKLVVTELEWNAGQQEKKLTTDLKSLMAQAICIFLLIVAAIIAVGIIASKKKALRYQDELKQVQNDLEKLMDAAERKIAELETTQKEEREKLQKKLALKSTELDEMTKKHNELESKQIDIAKQVSSIVRHRNEAIRELYQGFRVKSETRKVRSVIPLVGLIKDLNEKKRILHAEPKETFWTNLKLSVDGEYQGIASFVEKKYPNLTIREQHLFLLMCAGLPNPIIKICMGYSSDATVSNNKRRLMQERIGMNVKIEQFLDLYLQGKVD